MGLRMVFAINSANSQVTPIKDVTPKTIRVFLSLEFSKRWSLR